MKDNQQMRQLKALCVSGSVQARRVLKGGAMRKFGRAVNQPTKREVVGGE